MHNYTTFDNNYETLITNEYFKDYRSELYTKICILLLSILLVTLIIILLIVICSIYC